ncbi:hypothetical protein [Vibrio phage vB_VpS_PG28]|nr:hypothetical protein [Vibrio phage vB_VpS_PG28]
MPEPIARQKNIRWVSAGYADNSLLRYTCASNNVSMVTFLEKQVISLQQNDPIKMDKLVSDLKAIGIPVYPSMEAAVAKEGAL